jgi:hypothetical protein
MHACITGRQACSRRRHETLKTAACAAPHLGEGVVQAAAVALVAKVVRVGVDAQEADQAVQLSHTVLQLEGRTAEQSTRVQTSTSCCWLSALVRSGSGCAAQ